MKWKNKKMVAFKEAKRDAYDLRPALLWDLHRSINEELCKGGETPSFETLSVTQHMAVMLHTILDLSRGPALELWPVEVYQRYLDEQAPNYIAGLEKRPDGKLDEPPGPPFERLEIAKLYGECVCVLEPGPSTTLVLRPTGEKRSVATFFLKPLGTRVDDEEQALALFRDPARVRELSGDAC